MPYLFRTSFRNVEAKLSWTQFRAVHCNFSADSLCCQDEGQWVFTLISATPVISFSASCNWFSRWRTLTCPQGDRRQTSKEREACTVNTGDRSWFQGLPVSRRSWVCRYKLRAFGVVVGCSKRKTHLAVLAPRKQLVQSALLVPRGIMTVAVSAAPRGACWGHESAIVCIGGGWPKIGKVDVDSREILEMQSNYLTRLFTVLSARPRSRPGRLRAQCLTSLVSACLRIRVIAAPAHLGLPQSSDIGTTPYYALRLLSVNNWINTHTHPGSSIDIRSLHSFSGMWEYSHFAESLHLPLPPSLVRIRNLLYQIDHPGYL